MDYSDRRVNLIEEGIDLSIRITHQLEAGDIVRRVGRGRLRVIAAPDYLARHGQPRHPSELIHHECLGYTMGKGVQSWPFQIDGRLESVPVRSRVLANNGDVLAEAAARGLGIACQPDFIADPLLAAGRVRHILADFAAPELGIYAMLPSNRHMPHRVRVLMDFLVAQLSPVQRAEA